MNKKSYKAKKAGMLDNHIRSVVKWHINELLTKMMTEGGIENIDTARALIRRELEETGGGIGR